MRKFKHLLILIPAFALPLLLLACNEAKDEAPEPEPPIGEEINTTYTNRPFPQKVLTLNYCGHPLGDKDVTFSTRNFKTGTVVMENVIPGEKSTAFAVEMTERKGKPGESTEIYDLTVPDGRFFTESGIEVAVGEMAVSRNNLTINLDEVIFLPNALSYNDLQNGWWGLAADPIHLHWKIKPGKYTTPSGQEIVITPENSVNPGILAALPSLLGNMVFSAIIRDIHFDRQGRISAHYSSLDLTGGGEGGPGWTMSPQTNLCHYYMKDGILTVKPNIAQIIEQAAAKSRAASEGDGLIEMLQELLKQLDEQTVNAILGTLSMWVTDGIPLHISTNEDGSTRLSITEREIGALLKVVPAVLPLLKDTIAGLIPEGLGEGINQMIAELLEAVGVYAAATDEFEFGLNLQPVPVPED